jgi:hypothetical protein
MLSGSSSTSSEPHQLTDDQRQSYSPVGRHIYSGKSIGYRKTDGGLDAHGRKGRYVIHFLVAAAPDLTLSDVLRLPPGLWINGNIAQVDLEVELRDIAATELPLEPIRPSNKSVLNATRIIYAIKELAGKGVLVLQRRAVMMPGVAA